MLKALKKNIDNFNIIRSFCIYFFYSLSKEKPLSIIYFLILLLI